jgi:hypothetical protein
MAVRNDVIDTSIRLPVPLHEKLRRAAYEQHISQNAIILAALTDWLTQYRATATAAMGRRLVAGIDAIERDLSS